MISVTRKMEGKEGEEGEEREVVEEDWAGRWDGERTSRARGRLLLLRSLVVRGYPLSIHRATIAYVRSKI